MYVEQTEVNKKESGYDCFTEWRVCMKKKMKGTNEVGKIIIIINSLILCLLRGVLELSIDYRVGFLSSVIAEYLTVVGCLRILICKVTLPDTTE